VDAIQNEAKDPVNPATIGNRLSNAGQTVRRKVSTTPRRRRLARQSIRYSRLPRNATIAEARPCGRAVTEETARVQPSGTMRPEDGTGVSGSPETICKVYIKPGGGDRRGRRLPRPRDQYHWGRGDDDPAYTHAPSGGSSAATSHIWDRAASAACAAPPRDGGRQAFSETEVGTVKLTLRGARPAWC